MGDDSIIIHIYIPYIQIMTKHTKWTQHKDATTNDMDLFPIQCYWNSGWWPNDHNDDDDDDGDDDDNDNDNHHSSRDSVVTVEDAKHSIMISF